MDAADNHELPDGRWLPPGCTTPIVEILSPTLARAPRSGTVSSDTHTLSPDDCPSSVIRSYPVRTVSTATVPRRFERADNQRLSRRLVRLEDGHIHLWISSSGSKRPVVALHDPAGSGHLVLPFVSALADDRPIVVPDLPGNGESDRLLNKGTITSSSYARIVADLIRGLGIDEVDVIGRYSGGPIGMELSYLCPGLVSHLVIAAIAFYDAPPEAPFRDELLARYTPTVLPQEDGSHLLRAWHIMKSQALFWPWYRRDRDGIIKGDPQLDPELINRRVLELAICGDLYRDAYGALWRYPMRERLPTLGVPTLLCAPRWDPLYNDLAIASAAAPRAKVATLPDAPTEWHGKFRAFFDDKLR
jgi:pimeloyl-ACP methyl ester carboxylesterase